MGVLELFSNLFGAVQNALGLAKQRDSEKNAPNVQNAAAAQKEQDAQDQTRAALARRDLDQIRREAAE